MRQLFSRIILTLMCIAMFGKVSAESVTIDGATYEILPKKKASLTKWPIYHDYQESDVIIPESITYNDEDYSVISIGDKAFYVSMSVHSKVTSVIIPNSVTSIGRDAFESCTSLSSVVIPNSVTSIGDGAFKQCTALQEITIPNSVTNISVYTFGGCSSLTSVFIPESVTCIGDGAFTGCTSLTSITIPNSVTSIVSVSA